MRCIQCDSDKFKEEDGLFYCIICDFQSQEHHVQEVDDVAVGATQDKTGVGHGHRVKKKAENSDLTTKESLQGRPWTIYEGFQEVLLAQARALVDLGAEAVLLQTVFDVWANYLSRLGVAFTKKEKVVPSIVTETRIGRLRELHRGSFDNPLNGINPRYKNSFKGKREREEREKEEMEMGTAINDLRDGFLDVPSKRPSKSQMKAVCDSPEWMDMSKTLALCYIGLLITNPEILLCDVVRWAYEGKLPYLSVSHLLPSDMVFSSQDVETFLVKRVPEVEDLRILVNCLLRYMGVPGTEVAEISFQRLIDRFVQELYLPQDVKVIAINISNKMPSFKSKLHLRRDIFAMAYIIVALRTLFSVDGKYECELSSFIKKIQVIKSLNLFDYSEWKRLWELIPYVEFCPFNELSKDISQSLPESLQPLLEWYSRLRRNERKHDINIVSWTDKDLCTRVTKDYQDSVQKTFENALSFFDSSGDEEKSALFQVQLSERKSRFQNSSLKYLTQRETFYKNNAIKAQPPPTPRLQKFEPLAKDRSNRPDAYLWLLQLCAQRIGCQEICLDRAAEQCLAALLEPPQECMGDFWQDFDESQDVRLLGASAKLGTIDDDADASLDLFDD